MGRWWRQPDHYQWLSAYLAVRNLLRFTRYMMAAIVLALGVVPVLMLFTPAGPQLPAARMASLAVAAGCAVMAVLWATRWPNRNQSAVFVVVANACLAATCLLAFQPGTGIQGATAFAALAGYVAFFHTARYLALTLATAVGTALACAAQIAIAGDTPLAASNLMILGVSVLAVPFCVQVLVHTLGIDALNSDIDPLTDLPNRRAFRRSVRILAAESSRDGAAHLSVVMVDLDDFKRINDTAGHAAGDQTLVVVGGILQHIRRGDSIAARIGGEEFVVAVSGNRKDAIGLAERIRREIASAPMRVTASIGVASASLYRVPPRDLITHVDCLVESADRAMYRAKRSGGNRVHVVGHPQETYVEKPMASSTTASNGNAPWTTAERALSGAEARSTAAAASIDPTPAKSSAAPTRVPPEIVNATPTTVTTAKKRL
ncbi:GGDEF domain-containing protein [Mycolicibacterium hodleri]